MKRITILAAAGALVATPALGAWAAFADHDDAPAAHVRVADDRRGEPEPGHHGRHHRHHGADDKTATSAARHGADDAAGHQRHSGEAEPGDDHGNHAEPGDDHGGQGNEPGDDNGGHHGGDDNGGHDNGGHGGNDD